VAEALVPVRRRAEVLARAVAAEAVVGRALLLVLERLVGFRDLLEALLCVGLLRDVGVVLARELAVGLLDLLVARAALHAQRLVVVLVLHPPEGGGGGRFFKPCSCGTAAPAERRSSGRTGYRRRSARTRRSRGCAGGRARR